MTTDPSSDHLYLISLTRLEGVGDRSAARLLEHFGSAAAVFNAAKDDLLDVLLRRHSDDDKPIAPVPAERAVAAIGGFRDFSAAEKEMKFIREHGVALLTPADPGYPQRLLECNDRPLLLFYQGVADLNHPRMISVVGTRKFSEYGRQLTEQLCQGLMTAGCLIVSGLAYGIDAIAHKTALELGMQTIGVLGHGLRTVYPVRNATLSRQMRAQGGLLTEYSSATPARTHHFPQRNRIVAGLTAATVVVESPLKGGSLITAQLAESYHREVYAFPGRTTDLSMAGNNYFIRKNKAALITCAGDLIELLGWERDEGSAGKRRLPAREAPGFFEQPVLDLLDCGEPVHLDVLQSKSGLSSGSVAEALLFLEIKGWIRILPGNRYVIIGRNDSG